MSNVSALKPKDDAVTEWAKSKEIDRGNALKFARENPGEIIRRVRTMTPLWYHDGFDADMLRLAIAAFDHTVSAALIASHCEADPTPRRSADNASTPATAAWSCDDHAVACALGDGRRR